MVDINLLPENLRDREERAKKDVAKHPQEPNFALTNPPPLKPGPGRPVVPKPSPVSRAAQAAPPLPSAVLPPKPALPPRPTAAPKPPAPQPISGTLHVAPRVGEGAASVNLLRQQAPSAPTPPRPTPPAPVSAPPDTEALLSAAVKRELAKAPLPVAPDFVSRKHRSLWAWLTGWLHRSAKAKLPTLPASALPKPAVPAKPHQAHHLGWPHHAPKPMAPKLPAGSLPPLPDLGHPQHERRHRGFWAWLAGLFGHRHQHRVKADHPVAASLPTSPKPAAPLPSAPQPSVQPPTPRASPPSPVGAPVAAAGPVAAPARPATSVTGSPRPAAPTPAVAAPAPLRFGRPATAPHPSVGRPTRTLAINLIPTELSPAVDPRLKRRLVGLGAVVVACVLTVVGLQQWVNWYEVQIGAQVKATEDRISELTAAIDGYERYRQEGALLQEQIKTVEAALERHFYWTKIFAALERHTIDDVHFTQFSASSGGNLTLSAEGKDYRSVARQLVAFQQAKEFVASVAINSASALYRPLPPAVLQERRRAAAGAPVADQELVEVRFDISLTLVPEVFLQQFVAQRPSP